MPGHSVADAIEGVLAFDSFDAHSRALVVAAFRRHGIPAHITSLVGDAEEMVQARGAVLAGSAVPALDGRSLANNALPGRGQPNRRFSTVAAATRSVPLPHRMWAPDADYTVPTPHLTNVSGAWSDNTADAAAPQAFPVLAAREAVFSETLAAFTVVGEHLRQRHIVSASATFGVPDGRTQRGLALLTSKPHLLHMFARLLDTTRDGGTALAAISARRLHRIVDLHRALHVPWSLGGLHGVRKTLWQRMRDRAASAVIAAFSLDASHDGDTNPWRGALTQARSLLAAPSPAPALREPAAPCICECGAGLFVALPAAGIALYLQPFGAAGRLMQAMEVVPLPASFTAEGGDAVYAAPATVQSGDAAALLWQRGSQAAFLFTREPSRVQRHHRHGGGHSAEHGQAARGVDDDATAWAVRMLLLPDASATLDAPTATGRITTSDGRAVSVSWDDPTGEASFAFTAQGAETAAPVVVLADGERVRHDAAGGGALRVEVPGHGEVLVPLLAGADAAAAGTSPPALVGLHTLDATAGVVATARADGLVLLLQVGRASLARALTSWRAVQGLTKPLSIAWHHEAVAASASVIGGDRVVGVPRESAPTHVLVELAAAEGGTTDTSTPPSVGAAAATAVSRQYEELRTVPLVEVRIAGPGGKASTPTLPGATQAAGGGVSLSPPPVEAPKHGKVDPDNAPHVGGSMWAGGTGGSNTAGMGGRGGPYRLAGGQSVVQVTPDAAAAVPAAVRAQARAMAAAALEARLAELRLGERDVQRYAERVRGVAADIAQLRGVLASADARAHERVWLRSKLDGELDDTRIVECLVGERAVFKRRGESASPGFGQQTRVLAFSFDLSASMFRFNGVDGRLERSLQLATLIMEAFADVRDRFEVALMGHSGDSASVPLARFGQLPKTAADRLALLDTMVAHTQYCSSGDHTLEGIRAVMGDVSQRLRTLTEDEGGDRTGAEASATDEGMSDKRGFAVLISDANLSRYGIQPSAIGAALRPTADVAALAVFLSSGDDDEASATAAALPSRRAKAVTSPSQLPGLLRNVLSSRFAASF